MKIFKSLLGISTLLIIFTLSIFGLVWTFNYSLTIGMVTLASMYLFNILMSINTFVINKRSDALIKGAWSLLIAIPFFGGVLLLIFSHLWIWDRKKHKNSEALKNELFKSNKVLSTFKNIELLKNGDEKFNSVLSEIKKAKKFIHIQTFIVNGGIIFKQFEKELIKKAKQGVEVRISTDYMGNLQTPNNTYSNLKSAGIEFEIFNKAVPPFMTGKANHRNHDKLIIVDNKVAFTGGLNIGDDYSHLYSKYGFWNDLHFKLEGEIVSEMNKKFILDWFDNTKEKLESPKTQEEKGKNIGLLMDFPYLEEKTFFDKLINLINNSSESVKLITPYLVVPNEIMNALINAVNRGVNINIIITGKADKKTAYIAAKYYSEKLSSYGIKVMKTENFFMHSKAYIIDGKYSLFGTSNIDYRALFHHYETNFITDEKEISNQLTDYFNEVAKRSYLVEKKSINWNLFDVLVWWVVKITSPMM